MSIKAITKSYKKMKILDRGVQQMFKLLIQINEALILFKNPIINQNNYNPAKCKYRINYILVLMAIDKGNCI